MKRRSESLCLPNRAESQSFAMRQSAIAAIARDYAAKPENTLIVSPDNRSVSRSMKRCGLSC